MIYNFFSSTCVFLFLLVTTSLYASISCEKAITQGNYNQALEICENTLVESNEDEVNIWLHLIGIHHNLGNSDQESYYLAQVKNHKDFITNIDYQYRWNRRAGQKYYSIKNYQLAKKHLQQGLNIAKDKKNNIWLAKSFNDMGLVYNKLKEYKPSLDHYKNSLELKLKSGNSYLIGKTLNNIALAHLGLEEYDLSVQFYEQALDYYYQYTGETNHDERVYYSISHIYEDLTQVYSRKGNIEMSQIYAEKVIETFSHKESPHTQARALINIGKQHLAQSQYQIAQLLYERAKVIQEKNDLSPETDFYHKYALILFHQSQTDQAINWAQKGIEVSIIENDFHLLSQLYKLLSSIYQNKDINKAFHYLQKHLENRELFLQNKYNNDINNIKHKIQQQKIQHDLVNEQLINAKKSSKIQRINSAIFVASLLLMVIASVVFLYFMKKKKEREALIKSVKYHQQQLSMMQEQQSDGSENGSSQEDALDEIKTKFRSLLVDTMTETLSIWQKTTNTNHIEFAEKSQLWKVSIDNGNLRTRSLEKYLEIDRLPKNPRWRNVVKTCHFMLTLDSLVSDDRFLLELKLSEIMNTVKLIYSK